MATMSTFGEKLGAVVSSTYVGFALSLCRDVGILQVLLEAETPLTSKEIADSRELKERYVRELLASLATAELIHVSTNGTGTMVYHFEDEDKSAFKTQIMAFISGPLVMMPVYDTIKSCVYKAGPYGARLSRAVYDFLELYNSCHVDSYVDSILKHVDGLKDKLVSGIDVLEVGCGRGHLLAKIAEMFPKSTFTASDVVLSLQDDQKANLGHLPNVRYDVIDVCCTGDLPNKQFDWIYCANTIHDVPDQLGALKNIRKMMKPGTTFAMIDMATSGSPINDRGKLFVAAMYAISSFHCVAESYQREDSTALGSCWGKPKAIELVTAAGFHVKTVDLGDEISLFVCTQ